MTNGDLEILPVELSSPLLSFYFKLKAGNPKAAFESAKALSIQEQVPLIKTCLVASAEQYFRSYKLCLLFSAFPHLLSKDFSEVLPEVMSSEDFDGHLDFFVVLVRIMTNLSEERRWKLQGEITKYRDAAVVQGNPKLAELMGKLASDS